MAVLDEGDPPIRKRGTHDEYPEWWQVEAAIRGQPVEGWVHSRYLRAGTSKTQDWPERGALPAAHLSRHKHRRDSFGRCFPINEEGRPYRTAEDEAGRRKQPLEIARYLDPGNAQHQRYAAGDSGAEIYAYDFCSLARAYLPRV